MSSLYHKKNQGDVYKISQENIKILGAWIKYLENTAKAPQSCSRTSWKDIFMVTSTPSMAPKATAALPLISSILWATSDQNLVECSDSNPNKHLETRTEATGGAERRQQGSVKEYPHFALLPAQIESHYLYSAFSIWKCGKDWLQPEEANEFWPHYAPPGLTTNLGQASPMPKHLRVCQGITVMHAVGEDSCAHIFGWGSFSWFKVSLCNMEAWSCLVSPKLRTRRPVFQL